MTSRSRLLGLTLSALLCVGLTACGDGAPNDDDFHAALTKKYTKEYPVEHKDLGAIPGDVAKQHIKGDCEVADPGYTCPIDRGDNRSIEKVHLVHESDGWTIVDLNSEVNDGN